MDELSYKKEPNFTPGIFNKINILNDFCKKNYSYTEARKILINYILEEFNSAFAIICDKIPGVNSDISKCLATDCDKCSECYYNYNFSNNINLNIGHVRELYLNLSNHAIVYSKNIYFGFDVINLEDIPESEYTHEIKYLIDLNIKTALFISTKKDYTLETLIVIGYKTRLDLMAINTIRFIVPYIFLYFYSAKDPDSNGAFNICMSVFQDKEEEKEKVGFAFLDKDFNVGKCNLNFRNWWLKVDSKYNVIEHFSKSEQENLIKTISEQGEYSKIVDLKDDSEKTNYLKLKIKKVSESAVSPISYFLYINEVTEKVYLENQLKKHVRELKIKNQEIEIQKNKVVDVNKIKNQFLANISHELRTPLNAIIGFSEVLISGIYGKLTDKQEEYSNYINDSGYHLLNLINDVLDLSRLEAGKIQLKKETINIKEEVLSVLRLLNNPIVDKNIKVITEIQDEHSLKADKKRFRQIILNLIDNAVKFSHNGGSIKVSSMLNTINNNYEISIADTGIGIDASYKDAIFEPFHQIDAEYTRRIEGVGLGLALVKNFVVQQQGKIWYESELNKGTTFTFSLPASINAERLSVLYISNKEVPDNFNNMLNSLDTSIDHYKPSINLSLQEKIDNVDLVLANSDLSGNEVNDIIHRYSLCDNPNKVPLFVSSVNSNSELILNNIRLTNCDIGIKKFLNTDYSLLNCFDKSYKSFIIVYTQDGSLFRDIENQFDKNVFEVIKVETVDQLTEITSDFSVSTVLLDFSECTIGKEKVLDVIKHNSFNKTLKALIIPYAEKPLSFDDKSIIADEYTLKKVINNIKTKNKWRL